MLTSLLRVSFLFILLPTVKDNLPNYSSRVYFVNFGKDSSDTFLVWKKFVSLLDK